jgi:hypothetical protein
MYSIVYCRREPGDLGAADVPERRAADRQRHTLPQ